MENGGKKRILIIISVLLVLMFFLVLFFYVRHKKSISDNLDFENNHLDSTTLYVEKKSIDEDIVDNNIENGNEYNNNNNSSSNGNITINGNYNYLIDGDFLEDDNVTEEERTAMKHNTATLQYLIDNASYNQNIQIPKGVYYFYRGGSAKRGTEDYVIKPKNGVIITGAGTSDDSYTILKPYAEAGTIKYGLDMFYWNELMDSGGTNAIYLENVSFNDFIIDGENVRGNSYNSSGKGFMINLCRNCYWDNVVVKNTDGTGFGMDNVINGKITNSTAINCGKNASSSSEGASGFGIGTGYSNDESMYIENCKSIGNTKFGFFFEHQGRFSKYYTANKSKGFSVVNSSASGNLYNFGGLRANDVSYINCFTTIDDNSNDGTPENYTKFDIYFDDQTRRTNIVNFQTDYIFDDIKNSDYFYSAVKWGYINGITYGVDKNRFGVGGFASRAEAITLLWRYAGRPGDVLVGSLLNSSNSKLSNINTGFNDIDNSSWYVGAVKWGVDNNIINGVSKTIFSPNSYITRAQFITVLWRYAGKPETNTNNVFTDVSTDSFYYDAINWAYSKGIISDNTFYPNDSCTREQVITMIYRYDNIK
ncbi:MAG: S-layer homology domain-containing protein [Bacilli bacterium]